MSLTTTSTQDALGPLKVLSPPSGQVVSRKEVKDTARIVSLKDDGLIDRAIQIGTEFCELNVAGHRQFLTAKYCVPVRYWWCGQLKIPRPPLQGIDGIYYYDEDGAQQVLAESAYIVETPWRAQGTVELAPDQTWPAVQSGRTYPIEIHFTCGYGSSAEVPMGIKYSVIVAASQVYYGRRQIAEDTAESIENYLETNFGYGSYG